MSWRIWPTLLSTIFRFSVVCALLASFVAISVSPAWSYSIWKTSPAPTAPLDDEDAPQTSNTNLSEEESGHDMDPAPPTSYVLHAVFEKELRKHDSPPELEGVVQPLPHVPPEFHS